MKDKIYKEPIKCEEETNINIIYDKEMLSIYTNKVNLQKQLNRIIGEPTEEYKIKRSISGSRWDISLKDFTKINKLILKARIFDI